MLPGCPPDAPACGQPSHGKFSSLYQRANRPHKGGKTLIQPQKKSELSVAQIREIPEIAEAVLSKAGRQGHIGTEYPRCLVDPARYTRLKVGTRCSAATDFFVVGPNGFLRVCNHSPVSLVPWRDYDQLRHHPYWQKFVHKRWTPRGCEGCAELGRTCDGGCREAAHVAHGDVEAPDPIFRGAPPHRSRA